jgi:hypothetical protein
MDAEKIYSLLEEFYRKKFSEELDSWLEEDNYQDLTKMAQ